MSVGKIKKSDIEDIVEINPVQEGMLFYYLEDPESNRYFEQLCLELEGEIDSKKIKAAWEKVLENNKALRSVFRWSGLEQPIQIMLKKADLNFLEYDFSQIKNENALKEKCEALILQDRENRFSIDNIPFRITFCKKSERECLLIISNHHIILDGWSTGVILKQFISFYNDEKYSVGKQIFKLSEYADYMRCYNRTDGIAYWRNYLSNIDSPTLLECKNDAKGVNENCSVKINRSRINDFICVNRVTMAEFFYLAWAMLLRSYVNCNDVVFGTTISGRNIAVPGIDKVAGLFINTLPIRVNVADDGSLGELFGNVRKSLIDRQEYELIAQSEINQALKWDTSEPMYDSIVVVENYPLDKTVGEGGKLCLRDYSIFEKTNYNITVNIAEKSEFIEINILYNNEKFDDPYIKNMLEHFVNIIENIVKCGFSEKCVNVEMLSEAEKKRIIEEFNDTACSYHSDSCIHFEFEKNVEKYPERCAVKYDGKSLSYRELNNIVNYCAHNLRTAGVTRNSIVGILFERSFDMIIAILAVLKAGGAYMPISHDVPEERLHYMIENSGVENIMTVSAFDQKFKSQPALNIIDLDKMAYGGSAVYENPVHINEMHDLVYIIYTSGTTGNPKGVMVEHHSLMNRIGWMDKVYPIGTEDTVLQKTPYTFDVSVWELLWWSQKGACLYFMKQGEEKNPEKILDAVFENNITVMHFVPAMFSVFIEYLEDSEASAEKMAGLKRIFTSGEALNANQVNRFYKLNDKADIVNLYGPTEATIDVSVYHCSRGKTYTSVPIGKPIDNTKLFIVNSAHNIQPIGVAGELCICGVNLARGYLNRTELTEEKFRSSSRDINERFYKTGDVARLLPDGNIEYLGRCDDQVKIRGLRIELGEIENIIGKFDSISEVAAAVKKSRSGDNQIVAYYVPKAPATAVDINELKAFMLRYSPEYMIPAYFVKIDEMPKSANGKISRKELLKLKLDTESNVEYKAPETEIQIKIAEVWRALIDIEEFGIYDNFFMIGGDSIRAIRLVSKLNKVFGVNISISDLYHNSTISDLEELIVNFSENSEAAVRRRVSEELEESGKEFLSMRADTENIEDIFPLTDIQNGMLIYYLKDDKKDVYFEQFVFEAKYKDFDSQKYKRALEFMAEENPILRTAFDMDEYLQPVQIVYKNYEIDYNCVRFNDENSAKKYIEKLLDEDKARKFDITKDEKLWRFMVVSINDEFEYFIMTCHHAILDGWSVNYMMAAIHERYLKLLSGEGYIPQQLGITYKDALIDEMVEKRNENHRKFWHDELSGYSRLNLNVRYNHDRPEKVDRITKVRKFDDKLYDKLKSAAKSMKTSVKNICFGAYIYILHMMSGQNDFVVGFLTNNRTVHENGDKVLGCYLNTVPVRVKIPYGISWAEFQKQVDSKLLNVKKHERMSLFEISQVVHEKGSDNLFFDTLYNFMDFSMIKDLDTDDLVNSSVRYEGHQDTNTLFDFMLDVSMGQMKLTLRYTTSVLGSGSDEYIFAYFKNILECCISECDNIMKIENVLSKNEKYLLTEKFNDTDAAYDEKITLHQLFEKNAVLHSENNAIIYSDGSTVTYDALNKNSNRLANMLRENKVERNEFVAVIMERSPQMVETIMGILKSGAAYLPIEPYTPNARIKTMLESACATKIITCDSLMDRMLEITADMNMEMVKSISDPSIAGCSEENPENVNESTDIAYVIFTSGTTGTPKGVYVNHKTVVNVLEWVKKNYNINENDKLIFVTSICFDLSVYDMFGMLSAGATLRLTDSDELQEPERLLQIINEENITFWDSAPQALMRLVPFMADMTEKNSSLRLVFLSGDWIPVSLPDELKDKFENVRVVSLGGATEATIWSNYYNIDKIGSTWQSIPYGQPMQNARYYVLDDNLCVRPMGTPGELYIGGINGNCLALGYINDKKLTDSKFVSSPFNENERLYKTGDSARWYENGILEFLGRLDYQVKIHGYRIETEEIKYQILQIDSIKQAVVIVKESREREKYLCAFVVGSAELSEGKIKEKLSEALPEYMIPSRIVMLDSIPMTNNGKVDKKKLDMAEVSVDAEVCDFAQTPVQQQIETIWQEVLDVKERIPIDAPYYEYGGNSLNASMIVARIKKRFSVELTLREFFAHTTISEQAEYVEKNQTGSGYETLLFEAVSREYYPLSSAQERMYVLNELDSSTNYNATSVIKLLGKIDCGKIENVFERIIGRHDILRTAFVRIDGSVKQKVMENVDFRVEIMEADSENADKAVKSCIRVFKLTEPPLIRVCLIRLAEEEHILVLDLHHIVSDGISMNIITEEFLTMYEGSELEKPMLQYKDYAVWEKESDEFRKMLDKHEGFWREQLENGLPTIQLPYDFKRSNVKNSEGSRKYFELAKDKVDILKELATANDARLYHVLFSAYYLLLYKFSRQNDIVIGTAMANRRQTEVEKMLGVFANSLPVRCDIDSKVKFTDFLKTVTDKLDRVEENQGYPFDEMVRKFSGQRDMSRNSFFDVFFIMQIVNALNMDMGDFRAEPYHYYGNTAKFDLFLEVFEINGKLDLSFEYSTKLFKEKTIDEFVEGYLEIVEKLTEKGINELTVDDVINKTNTENNQNFTITFDDMEWFAAISGDYNPLHMNAEYAAVTPYGKQVVYGVLGALTAIGKCIAALGKPIRITSLEAHFRSPLFVNEEYDYVYDVIGEKEIHIGINSQGNVMTLITLGFDDKPVNKCMLETDHSLVNSNKQALEPSSSEIISFKETGEYTLSLHPGVIECLEELGIDNYVVCVMAFTSFLVGMKNPGKQALFEKLKIDFDGSDDYTKTDYFIKTVKYDEKIQKLVMKGMLNSADSSANVVLESYIRPELEWSYDNSVSIIEGSALSKCSEFSGKNVLVLGGSRGLGADLALQAASLGGNIFINYGHNKAFADHIVDEIKAKGCTVAAFCADISIFEEVQGLYADIIAEYGRIDVVINCAYPHIENDRIDDFDFSNFGERVEKPLRMTLNTLRTFAPELNKNKGRYICISSVWAEQIEPDYFSYSIAKAAIEKTVLHFDKKYSNIKFSVMRPSKFLSNQNCTNIMQGYLCPSRVVSADILEEIRKSFDKKLIISNIGSELLLEQGNESRKTVNTVICSTFTADIYSAYIERWLDINGIDSHIEITPYNQVFQQLLEEGSLLRTNNGVSILLIRFEDWIGEFETDEKVIEVLNQHFNRLIKSMIQISFRSTVIIGVFKADYSGRLSKSAAEHIETLYENLEAGLAGRDNIYFVDLTNTGNYGVLREYDDEKYREAKIPFTSECTAAMGTELARKIVDLYMPQCKVIVLDCDNTLWQGIIGEDGINGIKITEEYRFLQEFMKKQYENGRLLAICSKNNSEILIPAFDMDEMLLKKEMFVDITANWNPKYLNIRNLAKKLNLALDSFAFIDDDYFECRQMAENCPEVFTLQLPENKSEIRALLEKVWLFDCNKTTDEDKERTRMYQDSIKRQGFMNETGSLDDFLKNLHIKVNISEIDEQDMERASQMTYRTNQFNLSTIRRTVSELKEIIHRENYICRKITVSDDFGSYGISGLIIGEISGEKMAIDTLLLSCRVLGKNVEDCILSGIKKICECNNVDRIEAEYITTARNSMVAEFLNRNGWNKQREGQKKILFSISTSDIEDCPKYIEISFETEKNKAEGMLIKLNHIGLAVRDFNGAEELFRAMGYSKGAVYQQINQKSELCIFSRNGYDDIEFVKPIDPGSPTVAILNDEKMKFYHLCYEIESIGKFLESMRKNGLKYSMVSNAKATDIFNGNPVAFIYVENIGLIELLENKNIEILGTTKKDIIKLCISDRKNAEKFFEFIGYKKVSCKSYIDRECIIFSKKYEADIEASVMKNEDHSNGKNYIENVMFLDYGKMVNRFEEHGYDLVQTVGNASMIDGISVLSFDCIKNSETQKASYNWNVIRNQKHQNYVMPLLYNSAEKILELINKRAEKTVKNTGAPVVSTVGSDVEKMLISIWCDVLKVNEQDVDTSQNFFSRGGNSFALIEMNSRLKDELDIDIELIKLFEYPTIKALAAYIESIRAPKETANTEESEQDKDLKKRKDTVKKTLLALRRR